MNGLLWFLIDPGAVSWPQATLALGLALNTTLSAILLSKRTTADKRDGAEYYKIHLRLIRIERALEKCPAYNEENGQL